MLIKPSSTASPHPNVHCLLSQVHALSASLALSHSLSLSAAADKKLLPGMEREPCWSATIKISSSAKK